MCFFKKKSPVEPETILPTSTRWATQTEIRRTIQDRFPNLPLEHIYISDGIMLLCAYDDIALFLAQDETNKMEYVAEDLDCDDFSYRLMGQFAIPGWAKLAFGIVWTKGHALNCFIAQDRKFYWVEPQTDEIRLGIDLISQEIRFIMI